MSAGPTRITPLAVGAALCALISAQGGGQLAAQTDTEEAAQWAGLEQTDDYDAYSNKWNGLTTFVALARGMGINVDIRQELRWEEMSKSDVLFVLYPTSLIVPRHVTSFIRGGGRVVIGDDFGRSTRLFAELGLLRADAVGVGASSYYNDLAFAPMADAVGESSLNEGAAKLATNHPAVFTELGFTDAVYRFGNNEVVVSAGELGSGRLVALADPSVLINRMLQFDGNFGFAVNLLRFLSDSGSRRIVVITGRFRLTGEPIENERRAEGMNGIIEVINEWLGGINEYVVTRATARGLAIILSGALAFILLIIVPLRAKSELDGNWTRARPLMLRSPSAELIVESFDHESQRRQSFALAAAALRDGVGRRLAEDIGFEDPFHGVPEHVLYRELETHAGMDAVRKLRPIYRQLKNLPTRLQAASTPGGQKWDARFVSQREFERLSDATVQLYRSLEQGPK